VARLASSGALHGAPHICRLYYGKRDIKISQKINNYRQRNDALKRMATRSDVFIAASGQARFGAVADGKATGDSAWAPYSRRRNIAASNISRVEQRKKITSRHGAVIACGIACAFSSAMHRLHLGCTSRVCALITARARLALSRRQALSAGGHLRRTGAQQRENKSWRSAAGSPPASTKQRLLRLMQAAASRFSRAGS